ncbi:Carbamoyl-phosphate synthase, partial [Linderina macrospora]
MLGVSAHSTDGSAATNDKQIAKVKAAGRGHSYADYVVEVAATDANPAAAAALSTDAPILFVSFDKSQAAHVDKYATVSEHFKSWPQGSAIITNASGNDLASTLLLASLFNRQIHITDVRSADDLELIDLSRSRGLNVTCDVSVYTLFADRLPAIDGLNKDVAPLWSKLSAIDCFTIGALPAQVLKSLNVDGVNPGTLGYQVALPLLYTAVAEGRLQSTDIVERFCKAPRRIFGLPEQPETYVEIHQDRLAHVPATANDLTWFADLSSKPVRCVVHRVVMRGKTVFLDGKFYDDATAEPMGRDLGYVLRTMSSGPSGKQLAQGASAGMLGISTAAAGAPRDIAAAPLSPAPVTKVADAEVADEADAQRPASPTATDLASSALIKGSAIERPLRENRLADVLARYGNVNPFYMKHVLSVRQFTREDFHLLFAVAQEMRTAVQRSGQLPILKGRVMAAVFYEPSSRTSSSFQAAMLRLGGQVFTANSETSSVAKGETLEDTIRTFGSYADVITLRHPQPGSVQGAARFANVPLINAGDGIGEHPSQAMLDTFTIREELGTVNGLVITLIGDLKNGRTVHSLARIISQYKNVTLNYVSPESLGMPS